ncbi:hypothetical protein TNCV_1144431 [Trichonephila clavipes]|nr:hypothetical protein TNCV_1144431 [Trichonephila clavipes]
MEKETGRKKVVDDNFAGLGMVTVRLFILELHPVRGRRGSHGVKDCRGDGQRQELYCISRVHVFIETWLSYLQKETDLQLSRGRRDHDCEIMAPIVALRIRVLMPLMARRVEQLIHDKSIVALSPHGSVKVWRAKRFHYSTAVQNYVNSSGVALE